MYSEGNDNMSPINNDIIKNILNNYGDSGAECKNFRKTHFQITNNHIPDNLASSSINTHTSNINKPSYNECSPLESLKSDPFYLKKVRRRPQFTNSKQNILIIEEGKNSENFLDEIDEQSDIEENKKSKVLRSCQK